MHHKGKIELGSLIKFDCHGNQIDIRTVLIKKNVQLMPLGSLIYVDESEFTLILTRASTIIRVLLLSKFNQYYILKGYSSPCLDTRYSI